MATLTKDERVQSATVGHDRYPIPDKNHAKLALAMINKGGLSDDQKLKVIRKAHAVLSGKSKFK